MRWLKRLSSNFSDESFLARLETFETLVSKALSVAMVVVLVVALVDLFIVLSRSLLAPAEALFAQGLFSIFGLFLDVLIALEILENITAYLKRHVVQVELVIVTSLTAVARKIIIFDFSKSGGIDLIGLAIAIFALSISYWIVRRLNSYPTES
ncbi:MAG: phosphate-starvation-inducible PsiE family protein [Elainellaceae cyanobacterium]